ncbi:MAG: endonuclease [Saprospiraceae bacterium]
MPLKTIIFSVLLLSTFFLTAQVAPPNNLSGSNLRNWLKANWYDGYHNTLGYSGVDGARSYMYNIIDNHQDSVTCVYSDYKEYRAYDTNRTAGTIGMTPINCEHTVPQSFFGEAEPMVSDIHHLFPTYQNWNSTRSNKAFGEIEDSSTDKWMYLDQSQSNVPTTNIEQYSESTTGVFEPKEDHKGNLARAIFYFYTMYPTEAGAISLIGDLYTLYTWHILDPITADEISRNEAIGVHQGNRNPFILYPARIKDAWEITHPAPDIIISATTNEIQVSWNDLVIETAYQVFRSVDNVDFNLVANLNHDVLQYTDSNVMTDSNYYYYVVANFADGDLTISDTLLGQVSTNNGLASDLFLSEYVEGSSFNKAIEIANFTGNSVDLSNYTLLKQTNGSGTWSSLPLSGNLADQSVYLITNNNSSNTDLMAKTNLATSNAVLNFNGNDPIALRKNDNGTEIIIDLIGVKDGGGTYFGDEMTLIRKSNVTAPNDTYLPSEWQGYGQDYLSNVGQHRFGVVLPVSLISFTAKAAKKHNLIQWEISEAINHHYFELEKSTDGFVFERLARLEQADNQPTQSFYQYKDQNPAALTYYRLTQVDLDGKRTVYPIESVENASKQLVFALAPIPVKDELKVRFILPQSSSVALFVYNQSGQLVLTQNSNLSKGRHELPLAVKQLPKGFYLIKLQTNQNQQSKKFIKID